MLQLRGHTKRGVVNMDFSVDFHVRNAADDQRLVRAMDAFAEKVSELSSGSGFFMVRSELRQGRTVKSIMFETREDADVFLGMLCDDTVRAA
jgi:hypothetical protein